MKKNILVYICIVGAINNFLYSMELENPIRKEALQKAVNGFENKALWGGNILGAFVGDSQPNWFNGDKDKTKRVVQSLLGIPTTEQSLLAIPTTDWQPTAQEVDLCLIDALRKGDQKQAEAAIADGANVNCFTKGGGTPLGIAINTVSLVQLLLDKGANPNMPFGSSWTPLACAAYGSEGASNIVKLLLARGARIQISTLGENEGMSPISDFYGDLLKCIPVVRLLLTHVSPGQVASLKRGEVKKEQVIADIIETRKLLLVLSKRGPHLKFHGPEYKEVQEAFSLSNFESNYKQEITKNVETLLEEE